MAQDKSARDGAAQDDATAAAGVPPLGERLVIKGVSDLSEDANAGLATPSMDLAAAGLIAAISVWLAIESLRLPSPGDLFTAPGLLPFLTAASLLIMALLLGYSALTRRRAMPRALDRLELPADFARSLTLGGIVIVYVAAIQFVPVQAAFSIAGIRFVIGSFEAVSLVALTGLLRLYWGASLSACFAVSLVWIAFLSVVFRITFLIPLP